MHKRTLTNAATARAQAGSSIAEINGNRKEG
jgi:hypothetical protein